MLCLLCIFVLHFELRNKHYLSWTGPHQAMFLDHGPVLVARAVAWAIRMINVDSQLDTGGTVTAAKGRFAAVNNIVIGATNCTRVVRFLERTDIAWNGPCQAHVPVDLEP
jgi:hypothetical protein